MRIEGDFMKQAKEKGIEKWIIHHCSMCGYPCGFHFSKDQNTVLYDNGCNCTGGYGGRGSSWKEVADHYNLQSNQKVIEEFDKFWGFE